MCCARWSALALALLCALPLARRRPQAPRGPAAGDREPAAREPRARPAVPPAAETSPQPAPPPPEILLKSRRIVPEGAGLEHLPRGRWHGLLQFEGRPAPAALAALRARGVRLQGAIPGDAAAASIPAGFDPRAVPGVRWAGGFEARDKIAARFRPGAAPALVEFFPDVARPEAEAAVRTAGGAVRPHPSLPRDTVLAFLPGDAAFRLAALDGVAWIAPAPRAVEQGHPVHRCPGALTEVGPVASAAAASEGWDGPGLGAASLTYRFDRATADLPLSVQRGEILRALRAWSDHAAVTWSETTSAGRSRSVEILFAEGAHGDDDPFDGPSGILAHAYFPYPDAWEPIAGDVHFDDAETWRSGSDVDLFSVALHEAGHALGLDHSDDPDAVMYAYYQPVTGLTETDIRAIQSIYAPPGDAAPVARISASPMTGPAPLGVSFDGSGSSDAEGPIASWRWSFGDGASGAGAAVTHLYARAGTYTATLTVTDGSGRTATASAVIRVLLPFSLGTFRDARFSWDADGDGVWDGSPPDAAFAFGAPGDAPVAGDWNGDGRDDIGVRRGARWLLDANGNGTWDGPGTDRTFVFGLASDVPVAGDWDGDGRDEIGVKRGGQWYLDRNGNGVWDGAPADRTFGFGSSLYRPVAGDWDGDGRDEAGLFYSGWWFLDANGSGAWDAGDASYRFGSAGDLPIPRSP